MDRTFIELEQQLLTRNHTKVLVEKEYKYNAPHRFKVVKSDDHEEVLVEIHFQEGPIKEVGVNGVSNEDLIAMVLDRLNSFQNSEYECRENEIAKQKLEEALMWLGHRTNVRQNRGVLGTSEV